MHRAVEISRIFVAQLVDIDVYETQVATTLSLCKIFGRYFTAIFFSFVVRLNYLLNKRGRSKLNENLLIVDDLITRGNRLVMQGSHLEWSSMVL